MYRTKRFVTVTAALLVSVFLLVGCGSSVMNESLSDAMDAPQTSFDGKYSAGLSASDNYVYMLIFPVFTDRSWQKCRAASQNFVRYITTSRIRSFWWR